MSDTPERAFRAYSTALGLIDGHRAEADHGGSTQGAVAPAMVDRLLVGVLEAARDAGRIEDGLAVTAALSRERVLPPRGALAHAELLSRAGHTQAALQALDGCPETAEALSARTRLVLRTGDAAAAETVARRGLTLLRGNGHDLAPHLGTPLELELIASVVQALWRQSRGAELPEILERALALSRSRSDSRSELAILAELAATHLRSARTAEGTRCVEAALELARALGDRFREAKLLDYLASTRLMSGQTADAIVLYETALALQRRIGSGFEAATVLGNLAMAYEWQGRLDDAERALNRSLERKIAEGDFRGQAVAYTTRARIRTHLGHLDRARADVARGRAAAERIDDTGQLLWLDESLATIEHFAGNAAAAHTLIDQCVNARREMGAQPDMLHFAIALRARVAITLGRLERAAEDIAEAKAWFEAQANDNGRAAVHIAVVRLALARGDRARAERERERLGAVLERAEVAGFFVREVERLDADMDRRA